MGGAVQFSTVLMAMDLPEDDARHLRSMLKRSVRSSTMTSEVAEGNLYENLGDQTPVRDIDLKLLVQAMSDGGVKPFDQQVALAAARGRLAYDEATYLIKATRKGRRDKEQAELVLAATRQGRRFWEAVKRANLTEMEEELIRAAVTGRRGFQAGIAEKHINPETNEPYSRMTATNRFRRAYKLVKKELRRGMVAA